MTYIEKGIATGSIGAMRETERIIEPQPVRAVYADAKMCVPQPAGGWDNQEADSKLRDAVMRGRASITYHQSTDVAVVAFSPPDIT